MSFDGDDHGCAQYAEDSPSSDSDLEDRKKAKRGERYFCPTCPKSFTMSHNLQRHIRTFHVTGAPKVTYQCYICPSKFTRESHMTHHVRSVHEKKEQVQCKLCSKVFSNVYNLKQHKRYIHNAGRMPQVLYQCDYCARTFNRKTNLETHLSYSKCNPFRTIRPTAVCQNCGRVTLKKYMQKHIDEWCLGKGQGMKRARQPRAQKAKKIKESSVENENKSFQNDPDRIKKERDCEPIIKAEVNDEYEHGASSSSSFANFEDIEMSFVRRSTRKRKQVECSALNGGGSSESDHEKDETIGNTSFAKNIFSSNLPTELVDSGYNSSGNQVIESFDYQTEVFVKTENDQSWTISEELVNDIDIKIVVTGNIKEDHEQNS